jgi:glycosyltransferase involved in cell wall biosynthesis
MARLRTTYGPRPGALALVPNGADRSLFRSADAERTIDLIFVGSPAKYRNVDGVLKGVSLVADSQSNLRTVFLGWHRIPEDERFRLLAVSLSGKSHAEFVSPIARIEVVSFLQRAKLGIVSFSDEDAFRSAMGAKAYEYIACGVPLACLGPRGDSELRSFVESRKVGFYASSPEEFAKMALQVLCDGALWAELSRNCVVASSHFDRTLIAQSALLAAIQRINARRLIR